MAVLVYRSTELRDLTVRRCWFSVDSGWYDGITVRGVDVVIPGKSGRTVQTRIDDLRVIHLSGIVVGTDEANWKAVLSTLEGIFDPALDPADLVVSAPYLGLAAGTRTIAARTVDYRTVDVVPSLVTEYDVTLNAIGSPPDWS